MTSGSFLIESKIDAINSLLPNVSKCFGEKYLNAFPEKKFDDLAVMSQAKLFNICKKHLRTLGPLGEQHIRDYFDDTTITGTALTDESTLPAQQLKATSGSSSSRSLAQILKGAQKSMTSGSSAETMTITSSPSSSVPVNRQLESSLDSIVMTPKSPLAKVVVKSEPLDVDDDDLEVMVKSSGKKLGGRSRSRIEKPKKKKSLDPEVLLDEDLVDFDQYEEIFEPYDPEGIKPKFKVQKTAEKKKEKNDLEVIHFTLGSLEAEQLKIVLHNFLEVLKQNQSK
jgi:hypothetical protein